MVDWIDWRFDSLVEADVRLEIKSGVFTICISLIKLGYWSQQYVYMFADDLLIWQSQVPHLLLLS